MKLMFTQNFEWLEIICQRAETFYLTFVVDENDLLRFNDLQQLWVQTYL